jgi:hypothetical protein
MSVDGDLSALLALVCKCSFQLKRFEIWAQDSIHFYELRRDSRGQKIMVVFSPKYDDDCWFLVEEEKIVNQGVGSESFRDILFTDRRFRYEFCGEGDAIGLYSSHSYFFEMSI